MRTNKGPGFPGPFCIDKLMGILYTPGMSEIPIPDQQPQRQGSTISQIEEVKAYFRRETPVTEVPSSDPRLWARIANRLGCYDAADYFQKFDHIDWTKTGWEVAQKHKIEGAR